VLLFSVDGSVDSVDAPSSRARFFGGVVGVDASCRADRRGPKSAVSTRLKVILEGVFANKSRKGDKTVIKGTASVSDYFQKLVIIRVSGRIEAPEMIHASGDEDRTLFSSSR
jgi:hypothetical protein